MIKVRNILFLTCIFFGGTASAEFERWYSIPNADTGVVGSNREAVVEVDDTLIDIAARYGLGYNLIRSANPEVDAWLPAEGETVRLPFQTILPGVSREGIVINVAEMRLYHYLPAQGSGNTSVAIYPISVGRGQWATPITKAKVTGRAEDPIWYPPESIRLEHAARGDVLPRQVPAGPDNPLGRYILVLDIPSYFIHGTNKRFGIGMQVTHGCVRMYPEDIEQLVRLSPNNTPVTIINQVFKLGWLDQQLYLEVHKPLDADDQNQSDIRMGVNEAVVRETKYQLETVIDWEKLEAVISAASGVPEMIGYKAAPVMATGGDGV